MSAPDWEAEGLLAGLEPNAREGRVRLLDQLHAQGVPLEELRTACAEGRLMILPLERALGEEPKYSPGEIAHLSGVDYEFLKRQWQALGMPTHERDEIVHTDGDLEAVRRVKQFLDAGLAPDGVLEMSRVIGRSMARIAEAARFLMGESFLRAGATEYDVAQQAGIARPLTELLTYTLAHVFALQLVEQLRHDIVSQAALERGELDHRQVTVCFADIVGWTALSEAAEDEHIGGVADRLAGLTTEMLRRPVRIVKMIGDAAMLVSPEPRPMLDLALDLVDAADADPEFPELRVGVASGEALARWGDWYGRPVNLASRVCSRARPGSVLVTASVREACDEDGYRFSAAGEKRLKGIGLVPLWRVRRAESA